MKRILIFALMAVSLAVSSMTRAEDSLYSDPSKTIEVGPSEDFSIILESNRTTGFGWDVAEPLDENVVSFISCEYVAEDTGLAGSGGREIWTFRSACPGKTSISFKYIRPWEKDVPPAKNTAFSVTVK